MSNIAPQTFGNVSVSGFVNKANAEKNYFLLGTGSYTDRAGVKHYKDSVMVFIDQNSSLALPQEGTYVEVKGDLYVSKSTYTAPDSSDLQLKATINVRAPFQLTEKPAPTRRAAADAPSGQAHAPGNHGDI